MRKHLLAVAMSAAPVLAQANAVPGLDIGMYDVTDLAFQGRRGPAYPNGEAGFMVGHSWCNGGSVNLPWMSQSGGFMVDQYPRIAFLLARESGGRMVQISGRSFCKHSPTAFNFSSGPCAPCNVGSGSFFFVGCSDTYGSGTNSSQLALGPTEEINPWLGTWNPQGSYFDQGDPSVGGAAAMDSARSLTFSQIAAFDSVKNKMIVQDAEIVSGATYYGQVQGVVQGEPVGERGNNVMNRQVSISGSGGTWSTGTAGPSMLGSVLTRWQGATYDIGGNGADDGRFVVAVKVTGPTAGMWHYEYAIHNIDNNRGAASFRIPVAAGATVQNAGFRDIDSDPLNDWTFSSTATEVAFQATGNNRLQWNTIYNVWFDCSIEPGAGSMSIDQALPGPGALDVQVPCASPSGLSFAYKESVGSACGSCQGSFYELFSTTNPFDLAGRSTTMSLNGGAYTVSDSAVAFVPAAGTNLNLALNTQTTVALPFSLSYPGGSTTQLQVCSSGYVSPGTNGLQLAPSANLFLQGAARWAAAWTLFNPSAGSSSNVFFDATPSRAILTWNNVSVLGSTGQSTFQLQFFPDGTVHSVWQAMAPHNFSTLVGWSSGGGNTDPGSTDLTATLPTSPIDLCALSFDGLALDATANAVIGTSFDWQIDGILPGTGWGALFWSLQQAQPAIDLAVAGMPGCFLHVDNPVSTLFVSPGATQMVPQSIPNDVALVGLTLVGQAATYNPPRTPLGLVASNGLILTLGL